MTSVEQLRVAVCLLCVLSLITASYKGSSITLGNRLAQGDIPRRVTEGVLIFTEDKLLTRQWLEASQQSCCYRVPGPLPALSANLLTMLNLTWALGSWENSSG